MIRLQSFSHRASNQPYPWSGWEDPDFQLLNPPPSQYWRARAIHRIAITKVCPAWEQTCSKTQCSNHVSYCSSMASQRTAMLTRQDILSVESSTQKPSLSAGIKCRRDNGVVTGLGLVFAWLHQAKERKSWGKASPFLSSGNASFPIHHLQHPARLSTSCIARRCPTSLEETRKTLKLPAQAIDTRRAFVLTRTWPSHGMT